MPAAFLSAPAALPGQRLVSSAIGSLSSGLCSPRLAKARRAPRARPVYGLKRTSGATRTRASAATDGPSTSTDEWVVHKFGGSSVGSAQRIRQVADLISNDLVKNSDKVLVVVSAVGGVTNKLERLVDQAQQRESSGHYLEGVEELRALHETLADDLLPEGARATFTATLSSSIRDLRDLLRATWIARSASERVAELVMGFGELWSAQLLWATLRDTPGAPSCSWLDARNVLVVKNSDPNVHQTRRIIDWDWSKKNLDSWLKSNSTKIVVATGFLATDEDGVPTTLGRNGSDYSASSFAKLLDAAEAQIWTDVNGVFSADPRVVPEAMVIPSLTYKEAAELAYFGASVLHPDTMAPAMESNIPLRIRNTTNPDGAGTLINDSEETEPSNVFQTFRGVKGFSTVENVALLNVEGTGMIGVPGIASRLFSSLFQANISCILIAQASSEYSICAAVPGAQQEEAKAALSQAFRAELETGLVSSIDIVPDCSIIAMVGESMQSLPGVSARLFDSMYKAGVSIRAMAQGSSERNISFVVQKGDEGRALRAAHASFCLSDQAISVGVIGPGVVGGALIDQIQAQSKLLRDEFGVDIRVRAIATSRKMLLSDQPIDLENWRETFEKEAVECNLAELTTHVHESTPLPYSALCDCTASQATSDLYADWLGRGIHLVTPNKKANSGPFDGYSGIRQAQAKGNNSHFLYEANVGAGLPIISTIRDLLRTGDKFLEIQGIFSGTLSYIFNEFDGTKPFSAIVTQAKEAGYTEPDPREDLSGLDVARKVVILAREIGLSVELEDVPVKSLVPDELADQNSVSVEDFMTKLPAYDADLSVMAEEARTAGEKLRYVGVIDVTTGKCAVELRRYKNSHQFGGLQGSDNIVLFRTVRYDAQPLTIQGPGAGAAVTAAGVFADLLRLCSYLGAPSANN